MRRRLYILGAVVVVALIVAAVVLPAQLRRSRLLSELRDPSPAVRAAAVRCWDGNTDVDVVLSALNDEDGDVRLLTVMRLGERRYREPVPDAEKRGAALLATLKDRHAGVRRAGAESLGWLWPGSESALASGFKDADPRVRAGAALPSIARSATSGSAR